MLWDRKLACRVWVIASLYSQPSRIRRIGEQRTAFFGPLQSAGRHHHNQHNPLDCEILVNRIVKSSKHTYLPINREIVCFSWNSDISYFPRNRCQHTSTSKSPQWNVLGAAGNCHRPKTIANMNRNPRRWYLQNAQLPTRSKKDSLQAFYKAQSSQLPWDPKRRRKQEVYFLRSIQPVAFGWHWTQLWVLHLAHAPIA